MALKELEDFKRMMEELQNQTNLEESLSKILRDIESEISYQSIGIILKFSEPDLCRIKISRGISHLFLKNHIFSTNEFPFKNLNEMSIFHEPEKFMVEHNYKELILIPIKFRNEFSGAVFIDSKDSRFSDEEKIKLNIFASVISLIIRIFNLEKIIENFNETDSLTKLKSLKGVLSQGDYIFTQALRYGEDFVVAVLKLNRIAEFTRQYGMKTKDDLLIEIANNLKKELRKTEIIGRIYHDTFVILFPETNKVKAVSVISRLDTDFSQSDEISKLGLSWGLRDFSNQLTLKELIDLANEESLDSFRENKHYNFF
jgi:diguanylate cyclase (GGDEF)-like protein